MTSTMLSLSRSPTEFKTAAAVKTHVNCCYVIRRSQFQVVSDESHVHAARRGVLPVFPHWTLALNSISCQWASEVRGGTAT